MVLPFTLYNNSFVIDALAAFIGIFKIFRFFELQRNLHILRSSIFRGLGDLGIFTGMLMIMIVGFALAGMNIFGQESFEFVTEVQAFTTLFMTILGEFDFDDMRRVQPFGSYVFFVIYQIFVFFILVNIFLAILNDAYIAVTEQFANEPQVEAKPALSFRQRFQNLRAWIRQQQLDANIEKLRKAQRRRDLAERKEAKKKEAVRTKALQGMGMVGVAGKAAPLAARGVTTKSGPYVDHDQLRGNDEGQQPAAHDDGAAEGEDANGAANANGDTCSNGHAHEREEPDASLLHQQ